MNFRRHAQICLAPETEAGSAPPPAADAAAAPGGENVAATEAGPQGDAPANTNQEAPPAADAAQGGTEESTSTSLLSEEPAKDGKSEADKEPAKTEGEPKKDEAKAEADAGKSEPEGKAADADEPPPPEPIKYEPFKVPDGIKLDGDRLKAAEAILGAAQVPQEKAQELIDLYVADQQRAQEALAQHAQTAWNEQINKWKDEVRNDPTIGGNRLETSLGTAKAVIEQFGGSAEEQKALHDVLKASGLGSNIHLIRLLHNIGTKSGVFEDNMVTAPASGRSGREFGQGWYKSGSGTAA